MKQVVDVNMEIYEKMLNASIALRHQIREKHQKNQTVTKEEADFVNHFEAYVNELVEVMEKVEG